MPFRILLLNSVVRVSRVEDDVRTGPPDDVTRLEPTDDVDLEPLDVAGRLDQNQPEKELEPRLTGAERIFKPMGGLSEPVVKISEPESETLEKLS